LSALPGTVRPGSAIADTVKLDGQVRRAAGEGQLRSVGAGLDDLKTTAVSAAGWWPTADTRHIRPVT
jgi:hypothetical protein